MELTVSLGDSLGYKVFRFKDGVPVDEELHPVPMFSAGLFGVMTPHSVVNFSADHPVKNATVKFREQVLDRWSLAEGPADTEYTFERDTRAPAAESAGGARVYTFDKGVLRQQTIVLEPGSEYRMPLKTGHEKGFFVAEGKVSASGIGSHRTADLASEGDVVYVIQGEKPDLVTLRGVGTGRVVLVGVDLSPSITAPWEDALSLTYRAVVSDIDGVVTDPSTKEVPGGIDCRVERHPWTRAARPLSQRAK